MRKAIITTLLLLGATLSIASSTDKADKEKAEKVKGATTQVRVSAAQLFKEYSANEVAADGKYKGKVIEISGTVESIGKDILDKPYVTLKAGFMGVQCYFGKHDISKLSALKKGTAVTLKCRGAGKTVTPSLKACSIR